MTETKELTCIMCPMGCQLTITMTDGAVASVTGNTCPRGAKYAHDEMTNPMRMLTSTVRVSHGRLALLPVVSAATLPKGRIVDCAVALRGVTVDAPVAAGQVVVPNILGLGVDIVASRDMEAAPC